MFDESGDLQRVPPVEALHHCSASRAKLCDIQS